MSLLLQYMMILRNSFISFLSDISKATDKLFNSPVHRVSLPEFEINAFQLPYRAKFMKHS